MNRKKQRMKTECDNDFRHNGAFGGAKDAERRVASRSRQRLKFCCGPSPKISAQV
jgi:hypothetical protein